MYESEIIEFEALLKKDMKLREYYDLSKNIDEFLMFEAELSEFKENIKKRCSLQSKIK